MEQLPNIHLKNFTTLNADEQTEVLAWRNHELVRQQMFNKELIDLESHLNFIAKLAQTKEKLYFRVEWKDKAIGVIDFYDIHNQQAFWGIYLNPEYIGSSWGVLLEYVVLEYAFSELRLNLLQCESLRTNEAVLKIHDFFDFSTYKETEEVVFMEISKDTWVQNQSKFSALTRRLK